MDYVTTWTHLTDQITEWKTSSNTRSHHSHSYSCKKVSETLHQFKSRESNNPTETQQFGGPILKGKLYFEEQFQANKLKEISYFL